jgi:hypothetical protein
LINKLTKEWDMKYFRFSCRLNTEFPHDLRIDYNDTMREADGFCGYLCRMYEFYFPATRTDNVSTLTICFVDKLPEIPTTELFSSVTIYCKIDWVVFSKLPINEKPLYLIELCQKEITIFVQKANWNIAPFETAYNKIKSNRGLFREHWKKTVVSPDKQQKAQIYFEDDYERNGTYVDFTDKKGNLINRVQFTPRGYSVYCQDVGAIKWCDCSHVQIYYIQTPRAGADYIGNTRDYWIIGIDGTVEFHYPRVEEEQPNPHGLFNLGIMYWTGGTLLQDKGKGIELIRQSANLKFKHAQKWLEQND